MSLIIFGKEYELMKLHAVQLYAVACYFLLLSVRYTLWYLFLNNLHMYSSFNVKYQVSCPYRTRMMLIMMIVRMMMMVMEMIITVTTEGK